jgi:hypothetical protein
MENKFYLKYVRLNSEGSLYYECIYSNGLIKKIITIPFEKNFKIEVELKLTRYE